MENYETKIRQLQEEELQRGKLKAEEYQLLLAAYLNTSRLTDAIWLGKRLIVHTAKDGKDNLQLVRMAFSLENRDFQEFFRLVNYPWSETIKTSIEDLKNSKRDQLLNLIGYAYTTINETALVDLIHLPKEPLKEKCLALGWTYETDGPKVIIVPKAPPTPPKPVATSEELLFRLTRIVSFLEN